MRRSGKVTAIALVIFGVSLEALSFGGGGDGDGVGGGDGGGVSGWFGGHVKEAAKAIQKVKQQEPVDTQKKLDEVLKELSQRSDEELYVLKASSDVCKAPKPLDCKAVPSATVKPYVEMTLDLRRVKEAQRNTQNSFYIAAGGAGLGVISLIVSIIALLRKREQPVRATRLEPTVNSRAAETA